MDSCFTIHGLRILFPPILEGQKRVKSLVDKNYCFLGPLSWEVRQEHIPFDGTLTLSCTNHIVLRSKKSSQRSQL